MLGRNTTRWRTSLNTVPTHVPTSVVQSRDWAAQSTDCQLYKLAWYMYMCMQRHPSRRIHYYIHATFVCHCNVCISKDPRCGWDAGCFMLQIKLNSDSAWRNLSANITQYVYADVWIFWGHFRVLRLVRRASYSQENMVIVKFKDFQEEKSSDTIS